MVAAAQARAGVAAVAPLTGLSKSKNSSLSMSASGVTPAAEYWLGFGKGSTPTTAWADLDNALVAPLDTSAFCTSVTITQNAAGDACSVNGTIIGTNAGFPLRANSGWSPGDIVVVYLFDVDPTSGSPVPLVGSSVLVIA